MTIHCFFHNADFDGKAAGAIVLRDVIARHEQPPRMHGINYGDDFPWDQIEDCDTVYMVDFCLQPFVNMIRLATAVRRLIWIDHHKTAIAELEHHKCPQNMTMFLDVWHAGCELAWKYLHHQTMPLAVQLLGRYDVWDHSDERTLPFQYGMRAFGDVWPDDGMWDQLLASDQSAEEVAMQGRIVHRYAQASANRQAKRAAFEAEFHGLQVLAMNAPPAGSQAFGDQYDPARHDAMLAFAWIGGRWHASLYTETPGIDVGELAKRLGCGGHKGAAGFQSTYCPVDCVAVRDPDA